MPLPHEAIEAFLVTKTDMPFYSKIKFGQWFSAHEDITLKVSHISTVEIPEERTLGWYLKSYQDMSSIDIFIRDNTNIQYSDMMTSLLKFIHKVIGDQKSLIPDGIAEFYVRKAEDIPIPAEELQGFRDFSIYHLNILVESKYYKRS